MDSGELLELLYLGRLTTYPLGLLSIIVFSIALERLWRIRGLEGQTREFTRELVELLSTGNIQAAKEACRASLTPMSKVFGDGLRWRNIALEDLTQIIATARQEVMTGLRSGLWIIGTTGSLAPYIGLFGTVVGIMRAFREIGITGDTGFEVVSAGIAEALIATAVGLLVAIVALALYNWLQTRLGSIGGTFSRSSDRFIQALLYLESGSSVSDTAEADKKNGDLGKS